MSICGIKNYFADAISSDLFGKNVDDFFDEK